MNRIGSLLLLLLALSARAASLSEPLVFTETCDASAAIALSADLFVVANDEDSILRFYRTSQPGKPVQRFDLRPILSARAKSAEADLEGATRLGSRVFFIASHGRNAEGKPAPNRHRLFAVEFTEKSNAVGVQLVGKPYANLVTDLANDPKYEPFHLAEAAGKAPKSEGGFNIEALAATTDGTLLIGFRNPIPQGRALLVPLLNPNDVIAGQSPRFGEPLQLDLGGLGLRDIASTAQGYYLLAGPAYGDDQSRLFFWAGGDAKPRIVSDVQFPKINPEGICFLGVGNGSDFLIVSDDGTRKINGKECKSLPESDRQFRAYRFTP